MDDVTFAVLGTGGIGKAMVRLGAGLGMQVIAWNRSGVRPKIMVDGMVIRAVLSEGASPIRRRWPPSPRT
jgi:lactate dehydrogenase-like 2-hydroxyacid dehydrogenase